jgi:hypothetical protein
MASVKGLRVVTLLVTLAMAAGPTLLDRCLVSCHDEAASAAAVPACHEHAQASDQLSIHGIADCGHDHEGLPADSVSDTRSASFRHAQPAVAPAGAFAFDCSTSTGRASEIAWRADVVAPVSINRPLRL